MTKANRTHYNQWCCLHWSPVIFPTLFKCSRYFCTSDTENGFAMVTL